MNSIDLDFGDIVLSINARVKHQAAPKRIVWRIGAPRKTTADERATVHVSPTAPATGKVDLYMDVLDDNRYPLAIGWTDDAGNPTAAPENFTAVYTIDDSTHETLVDNGDGTAQVTPTGSLGPANVHVEVSWSDANGDHTATGDVALMVVADMASRVNIAVGAGEHV